MNKQDQLLWTHHQTDNVESLNSGHPRQRMLLREFAKHVKSGGKVLEIGFGDGYLLGKLSKEYTCFGSDISQENVDQMEKKIPAVKFQLGEDGGKLAYSDEFFDGFIASEVLEHMSDTELDTTVTEIKRILKPGGYAIITVPAEEILKDNECYCPGCGIKFHKWGHKQSWTSGKFERVFNGFRIVKIKKVLPLNPKLNFFGLMEWFAKNIFLKMFSKKIPGATFLVVIAKS